MDIFIVDHHILFREGLVKLLDQHPDFRVIGDASTLQQACELAIQKKPQLILIGVESHDDEAMDAIKDVCPKLDSAKIVILYNEEPSQMLFEAIQWGVKGFIPKNTPISTVLNALKVLKRGEMVIPREFTNCMVEELIRLRKASPMINHGPPVSTQHNLTPREQEILIHLGSGATNRMIARRLVISENTVRVHVHNILEKLKLNNRREVAKFAQQRGLVNRLGDFE